MLSSVLEQPCIDTPYVLLPLGSILQHLGKIVLLKWRKLHQNVRLLDNKRYDYSKNNVLQNL